MRRRDIYAALLGGAGFAVAGRAQAQSCTPPCYEQTQAEIDAGITPINYYCPPGDVRRYGALGDGNTVDTDAFARSRLVTNGRYFVSPGDYVLQPTTANPSFNVWEDEFFAADNVSLSVNGGPARDVSGAFASGWQFAVYTPRYLTIKNARFGKDLIVLSDGESPSDSHRVFLPWDIRRDSHALIMAAESAGGTTDVLWRRSTNHSDSLGNRCALNYEESIDRWSMSFATSASGPPQFDLAMAVVGGPMAKMTFPALAPEFNQGIEFKQRAAGGFRLGIVPNATNVQFKNVDTGEVYLTISNQGIQFNSVQNVSKPVVTGAKNSNALASLISALAALGLIVDETN